MLESRQTDQDRPYDQVFPESVQARREQVLNLITLGLAAAGALTCLWMFILWLRHPEAIKASTAVAGAAILMVGAIGHAFFRAGQTAVVAWMTLLGAVAIAAYSVAMRGIISVNVILLAPTVALAGMLIDRRAALIVFGLDALIAVSLGLAQAAGWQPPLSQTPLSLGVWVVIGSLAFLLLVNGLSWWMGERSLLWAEMQSKRLRAANKEQQRLFEDLEIQSQYQARLLSTLRQLATPIIPVSRGIIILPLIGHIDPERLEQIRSSLLSGIAQHRARIVLLEMTGLSELSAGVAQGLVGLADAARLLGAELIVVGLQSAVARVIVEQKVDTGHLVAQPNLENALDYALTRRQKPMIGDWPLARSPMIGLGGGNGSGS